MSAGFYSAMVENATITGAVTCLQLTAPSTAALKLTRVEIGQAGVTASAMQRMALRRKSATATGLTSITPRPVAPGYAAAGATAGHTATGEGTDTTDQRLFVFNVLAGYLWAPTSPKEEIVVPPSGIICLKALATPGTTTGWSFQMDFEEIG